MLSFEDPIAIVTLFLAMSMVPFAMLGLTSFVKLSVVFGLLRNALGAQQVPSAAITTLLSLALTVHIMQPVVDSLSVAIKPILAEQLHKKKKDTVDIVIRVLEASKEPISHFLRQFSSQEVRVFFATASAQNPGDISGKVECTEDLKTGSCRPTNESLLSLIPSFIISELRHAFTIGVLIFLPFLIVDLVVANILVGMGMMMVSPVTISMPLKLMLFVLCDGWFLLSQSLILSYR